MNKKIIRFELFSTLIILLTLTKMNCTSTSLQQMLQLRIIQVARNKAIHKIRIWLLMLSSQQAKSIKSVKRIIRHEKTPCDLLPILVHMILQKMSHFHFCFKKHFHRLPLLFIGGKYPPIFHLYPWGGRERLLTSYCTLMFLSPTLKVTFISA